LSYFESEIYDYNLFFEGFFCIISERIKGTGDFVLKNYDYDNMPIVDIVNDMIIDAARRKASDIHFDQTPGNLIVRIRVDGELIQYAEVPMAVKKNLITRIKIISGMNITNTMFPQTGAINFELNSKNHNMRVSSLPIVDGEKIVIHISNYARNIKSISKMGFSEDNIKKIKELVHVEQGIFGADMKVSITNDGPITIALESESM